MAEREGIGKKEAHQSAEAQEAKGFVEMKSSGSSDTPLSYGQLTVKQVTVTGIDALAAARVRPAIEDALRQVSDQPPVGVLKRIRINLPYGADEQDVSAAVLQAIRDRQHGR